MIPRFARFESLLDRLRTKLRGGSGALLRGSAMLAVAEMGNRVTRILTAIALARTLSTVEFGLIALIAAIYELVRTLIHNGLGARIVQAREAELDEVCSAVNRLNWGVGTIMCAVQLAIAWPLQYFFEAEIAPMLMILAVVHLLYPIGLIRACLALRDDRLGFTAVMLFCQISLDNILTALMAAMGYGVWAAVAPKVIVAILWVAAMLIYVSPRKPSVISSRTVWNVIAYARNVLGAEVLNTLRGHADKLIVGKALGLEAFGIYSFATNTGSGIATGLASALGQAALPYLSKGRESLDMRRRFNRSVAAMSMVIMPLVTLQVVLAPWYVPLVFGEKWTPAIPALMLMCLGTLSRPLVVATSQLLRASGNVDLELQISKYNAVLFVLAIIAGLPYGVEGVAAALAVVNILPAIIFARAALARASKNDVPTSPNLIEAHA